MSTFEEVRGGGHGIYILPCCTATNIYVHVLRRQLYLLEDSSSESGHGEGSGEEESKKRLERRKDILPAMRNYIVIVMVSTT